MLETGFLSGDWLPLAFRTTLLCVVGLVQHFLQNSWHFHEPVDLQKAELFHSRNSQQRSSCKALKKLLQLVAFTNPFKPRCSPPRCVYKHTASAVAGKELLTVNHGSRGHGILNTGLLPHRLDRGTIFLFLPVS